MLVVGSEKTNGFIYATLNTLLTTVLTAINWLLGTTKSLRYTLRLRRLLGHIVPVLQKRKLRLRTKA